MCIFFVPFFLILPVMLLSPHLSHRILIQLSSTHAAPMPPLLSYAVDPTGLRLMRLLAVVLTGL